MIISSEFLRDQPHRIPWWRRENGEPNRRLRSYFSTFGVFTKSVELCPLPSTSFAALCLSGILKSLQNSWFHSCKEHTFFFLNFIGAQLTYNVVSCRCPAKRISPPPHIYLSIPSQTPPPHRSLQNTKRRRTPVLTRQAHERLWKRFAPHLAPGGGLGLHFYTAQLSTDIHHAVTFMWDSAVCPCKTFMEGTSNTQLGDLTLYEVH